MSPTQEGDVPNPRHLAVIYFCFYSATSLLVTFWPHYMTSLGMDSADIGIVFGVGTIVGIFAQPTLTALSDYVGRPGRALQVLSIATLALMLGIPFVTGFLGMAILLWVSAIPRSATSLVVCGLLSCIPAGVVRCGIASLASRRLPRASHGVRGAAA